MIYFDEEKHRYTDERGNEFFGVTGAIGKILNKVFPDLEKVKVHTSFGSQVHKELEEYIMRAKPVNMEASKKAVALVEKAMQVNAGKQVLAEYTVTDMVATASNIDIVIRCADGKYVLMDIKTGEFDRVYSTIQLQCYRTMFEKEEEGNKVKAMYVVSTKDNRLYSIPLDTRKNEVEAVFSINKEALYGSVI